MRSPTLADLPPPSPGKTGWPWTVETPPLPDAQPDGTPWPRISIVTPSYNQGQFIEETIRSVLLQGYPDVEYIIMDGGSTDDSVRIIEKYAPWLAHWQSRRDKGQADAINKGLFRSSGLWFQNINSDDVLLPGALGVVGRARAGCDLCCGSVIEFSDDHTYTVANAGIDPASLLRRMWRSDEASWHQPGVFMKRAAMIKLGGYEPGLHYTFDLHLPCRYVERYPTIDYHDVALVRFRIHPAAKSSAWTKVYEEEAIRAREMLAAELAFPRNRQIAAREAQRRRLMQAVSNVMKAGEDVPAARRAWSTVRRFPALGLDRMFLGSLRRRPILWLRALVSADRP